MKIGYNKYLHYVKKDPGSGFVLTFMGLLSICAFLLMFKLEKAAEHLASWAYLFLIIGGFIKFIQMIRE